MPKRKAPCVSDTKLSVSSLDAAFDILANDTFSKLDHLVRKFEAATSIQLDDGIAKGRWEEACKRYWVTKAMEDLCCVGTRPSTESDTDGGDVGGEGRPLPASIHPGPVVRHKMSAGEGIEWRRWVPKVGDMVLVELPDDRIWPGKIIDRRIFYQGRTTPRGNHFFPVRIYSEEVKPSVTVKSRIIPLDMRPDPPLLASTTLLNAYNHARHPATFDRAAEQREKTAAASRIHPGVHDPETTARNKAEKDAWNAHVNWIMNERRVEKLRNLNDEREVKLRSVAKLPDTEASSEARKRSCHQGIDNQDKRSAGIFSIPQPTPPRSLTPFIHSITPRPMSPRRLEKRRNGVHAGFGEYSPRPRGTTYTPPRILPTGDETAPSTSPTPVPSTLRFDFVSPSGLSSGSSSLTPRRSGSTGRLALEAVEEEVLEDEGEGEWQVVQRRKGRRNSAPCQNTPAKMEIEAA